MTPKICVSLMPWDLGDALKFVQEAEACHADFVEVRLDHLDADCDLALLAAGRRVPLIATDKAQREVAEHRFLLLNAAKSGFRYVDVDLDTPNLKELLAELRASSAKCIVSFHNHKGTLSLTDLHGVLKREIAEGADICKIVTTATRIEDNLGLLQFVSEASANARVVCFAMGELGKTSRLLSPMFGGFFTFAALETVGTTAPGQMTLREMKAAYDLLGFQ